MQLRRAVTSRAIASPSCMAPSAAPAKHTKGGAATRTAGLVENLSLPMT